MKIEQVYRKNTINLAKHHKKYCNDQDCCISLYLLLEMAKDLGIQFTKEEIKYFL